jgi:transcriptional regulator with XRE-family HTH domain
MPQAPKPKRKKGAGKHRAKPDPLAERFGERLRRLRAAADFTFDAFVEETGLGRGYVSELERGLAVPTLSTLAKIAKALELPIADLVLGDTPRELLYEATRGLDDAHVLRLRDSVTASVAKSLPAADED